MENRRSAWPDRFGAMLVIAAVAAGAYLFPFVRGAAAAMAPATIIDEWSSVQTPPPPALKAVTVDPKTTAYLILDIVKQTCNPRPRCLRSVPKIAALLARATDSQMLVVYSYIVGSTLDDYLADVKPFPGQPAVQAGPDKFLGTNLDAILKGANIKTVIVSGTSAEGAVLNTAGEAAQRGYQVVVPADLMSSNTLYAEQYVAWHLTHAPVVSARVTLTRSDMIKF